MGLMWCISTLLLILAALCLAETVTYGNSARSNALSTRAVAGNRFSRFPGSGTGDEGEEAQLLDIVLVASVDGRFHALNRTSGQKLWSMSPSSANIPSSLAPLVRTKHATFDPDLTDDDSAHQELYVIEPQTGDIYVMATPTSPLQRLSFSMSQLVEMSPFTFPREDDERIFVGRKDTSLLSIELKTGRVKAINSECPWDPFEDLNKKGDDDLDLDELEDFPHKREKLIPTEVFIGRTDYHISIYTRSTASSGRKAPIQNLSFSTYGPNNQDNLLQAAYRRTADNMYIESLPNGQIMSFKSRDPESPDSYHRKDSSAEWGTAFDSPVVAVFDVLNSSRRQDPFVLLQPRPSIPDVLSSMDASSANTLSTILNTDTAYVGLVEETGSLFVMGAERFPLIAFSDTSYSPGYRLIDAPGSSHRDLPSGVDSVTKRRKLLQLCAEQPLDWRCLTGKRPLDASALNTRQLPGVPSVALSPDLEDNHSIHTNDPLPHLSDTKDNSSTMVPSWIWPSRPSLSDGSRGIDTTLKASAVGSCLIAIILGTAWFTKSKLVYPRSVAVEFSNSPKAAPASGEVLNTPSLTPATDDTNIPVSAAIEMMDSVTNLNGSSPLSSEQLVPPPIKEARASVQFVEPDVLRDITDSPVNSSKELGNDGEDSDNDGADATPKKRKALRRRRGKKGKGGSNGNAGGEDGDPEMQANPNGRVVDEVTQDLGERKENDSPIAPVPTLIVPSTPAPQPTSLIVSDTVLGFGSHGTVVFKGSLQGRAVAVKRLLQDFVTLASREVSILQESDDHPNVIRYYYQEAHASFLYIALELCPASLADVIECPDQFREISVSFDPKRALRQITSGLRHLHSLKLVHRDIKPQNILISGPKKGAGRDDGRRMLISDFGLCKKLEVDQTSFLPTAHGAMAAGTVGWRAPEILRGEVKLDDSMGDDTSQSSRGSVGTPTTGTMSGKPTRLTKSVDIFALGCLFFYVLTNGSHPFGDRFEREVNILKNAKCLDGLERFGEEGSEAVDLITNMLDPEACHRPDTTRCLLHPFFWDPGRRLNFLQDASDRFEIMCRDPRDQLLIRLETGAFDVVGHDWHSRLDKVFIENLGKFRKYDGKSVQDLLRALRNKKHHYQDIPEHVKRHLGPMPEGFLSYFTRRFPRLFLHVHGVISETSLSHESMFRSYFELADL
ncbi:hypothetical protein BJ138DRAFT_1140792 [Hygrophoropsis aurantiaca]|uniref:Uncharacterized protein n=1 Tax=Hygrophoropsis aurantiaca TaxID=72124 RepID=A0ACB8ARH2_9AGAM|nr:hypothetical protein BJ138DRAFT_1140792 [Hygrophoropsis aurantiaca]